MRSQAELSVGALLLLAVPASAFAWDGPRMWYDPADGASPGGGGILGTGSARDYAITCDRCHVDQAEGSIDARLRFTPALADIGGARSYEPGQSYDVEVILEGELVGRSGCGAFMRNVNGMAVSFEDGSGRRSGTAVSDTGQSQAACPADFPSPPGGTTVLYRDCAAVLGLDRADLTRWSFTWTAPPAGSGRVDAFWGVVDGSCDMRSTADLVVSGRLEMSELRAEAAPRRRRTEPSWWPPVAPALLAIAVAARRRSRHRS